MTVIVYKDGVMAADTGAFRGNFLTSISFKKIIRLASGTLIGCAGYAPDIEKFHRWAMEGFLDAYKPEISDDNFGAIVATPGGELYEYDHKLCATDCSLEGWACEGEAQEFCFALHTAGYQAHAIVAQAIGYCVWAAGQVYALELDKPAEPFKSPEDAAPYDNLQGDQGDDPSISAVLAADDHIRQFLDDRGL